MVLARLDWKRSGIGREEGQERVYESDKLQQRNGTDSF